MIGVVGRGDNFSASGYWLDGLRREYKRFGLTD